MKYETWTMVIGTRAGQGWSVFAVGTSTSATQVLATVRSYEEAKERSQRTGYPLRTSQAIWDEMAVAGKAPTEVPEDVEIV